jgi:hypothetical protein
MKKITRIELIKNHENITTNTDKKNVKIGFFFRLFSNQKKNHTNFNGMI